MFLNLRIVNYERFVLYDTRNRPQGSFKWWRKPEYPVKPPRNPNTMATIVYAPAGIRTQAVMKEMAGKCWVIDNAIIQGDMGNLTGAG